MKTKLIILLLSFGVVSCSTRNASKNQHLIELSGKLEKLEMSGFQYGTHIIISNDESFALMSKTIDLNLFTGKVVTAKGKKIDGYPIDGGPDYVEIKEIKIK